jgi:hypothetical protein
MSTLPEKLIRTPIYVYQMGKVGSTSVFETLGANTRCAVIHAHRLDQMMRKDQLLLRFRQGLQLPINVICPIRDPISRNVSAFFQNFKRDTGFDPTDQNWAIDELRELFLKNHPHDESINWFDLHFGPVFGIDVYAETFPISQRYRTYKSTSIQILVYRTDIDQKVQLKLLSEFVESPLKSWTFANLGQEKTYEDLYSLFCSSVTLPDTYLARMNESKYARHFWNASELDVCSAKWSSARLSSK